MTYQCVTGNFPTKGKPQNEGAAGAANTNGANQNSEKVCKRVDAISAGAAQAFPIIVAEWQRNAKDTIRVSLGRYNGRHTIDCRCWWRNDDGELKPGKAGLTLSVQHLDRLATALATALVRAREMGLVDDGGRE